VNAQNVRDKGNEVIGMIAMPDRLSNVMVVSEKGYGKRSDLDEYRITKRGGKGVKTINVTEKTGNLIAIKAVTDKDDLMIINKSGIIIRMAVADLRIIGRATQGVKLINLKSTDEIAAVTKVDREEEIVGEIAEGAEATVATEGTENTGADDATDNTTSPDAETSTDAAETDKPTDEQ